MHKKVLVLLVLLAAITFQALPALASTQDFVIDSFESNYLITQAEDGVSMAYVREGIVALFPESDQNHGILRAIPQTYQGHSLELQIDRVMDQNGTPWEYETYTENDNLVLKIGDSNKFVHGTTKYFIDYHMRGVINKQPGQDEFYWNINGNQWQQQINSVKATVHVDDPARGLVDSSAILPQKECQTGVYGSTQQNCIYTASENGASFQTVGPLMPGENLSVVMAFSKDTFAAYKSSPWQTFLTIVSILGYIVPALIALAIVLRNYLKFGRDPASTHTVVPEYLPPKEVSVLVSSNVFNETFDYKAVSATVIDLAVRHYVKIYEVKDKPDAKKPSDYKIELVKDPSDLKYEEKDVVDILFGPSPKVGNWVQLKDLREKAYVKVASLDKNMDERVTTQGYFTVPPKKAKRPYFIWGAILFAIGALGFQYAAGFLLAGAILFIASPAMPARTAKGVDLKLYLLGVREYIKLAEADRLKVLQSPHGELTEKINIDDKHALIKLYEKLLPYAMLFGLEKDWAKELAVLYEAEHPTWYGSSGTFNALYFANAVNGFGTAGASSFAPPSSSSGSGFGGGSGGGGGGGGGGGW